MYGGELSLSGYKIVQSQLLPLIVDRHEGNVEVTPYNSLGPLS